MTSSVSFRPKARILQLLGDELIGSARLAVFELVKNAYDADATRVTVSIEGLNSDDARIFVRDNGSGMSAKTIREIWFTPAHEHRRRQRESGERSPLGRLPLGEKGLGRFAVHKLGERIRITTRERGSPEAIVELDWQEMLEHDFLDEIVIQVQTRDPVVFKGNTHGTLIEISALREAWSRGAIRDLYRSLMSIADPTGGPSDFEIVLKVPGNENLLEDLPDPKEILKQALWEFDFSFDGNEIEWRFEFRPYPGIKMEQARQSGRERLLRSRDQKRVVADAEMISGIGPISRELSRLRSRPGDLEVYYAEATYQ